MDIEKPDRTRSRFIFVAPGSQGFIPTAAISNFAMRLLNLPLHQFDCSACECVIGLMIFQSLSCMLYQTQTLSESLSQHAKE
ncbi:MAG TPA: hypothetical protein VFF81_10955 [Noviherbaspirillum sp.]|nr:hypothetical protein [Noviherbaspirillum sp.]